MTWTDSVPADWTDWTDINALIEDMQTFMAEHSDWILLPCDGSGRKAWVAFKETPESEEEKVWSITLPNLHKSSNNKFPIEAINLLNNIYGAK